MVISWNVLFFLAYSCHDHWLDEIFLTVFMHTVKTVYVHKCLEHKCPMFIELNNHVCQNMVIELKKRRDHFSMPFSSTLLPQSITVQYEKPRILVCAHHNATIFAFNSPYTLFDCHVWALIAHFRQYILTRFFSCFVCVLSLFFSLPFSFIRVVVFHAAVVTSLHWNECWVEDSSVGSRYLAISCRFCTMMLCCCRSMLSLSTIRSMIE